MARTPRQYVARTIHLSRRFEILRCALHDVTVNNPGPQSNMQAASRSIAFVTSCSWRMEEQQWIARQLFDCGADDVL